MNLTDFDWQSLPLFLILENGGFFRRKENLIIGEKFLPVANHTVAVLWLSKMHVYDWFLTFHHWLFAGADTFPLHGFLVRIFRLFCWMFWSRLLVSATKGRNRYSPSYTLMINWSKWFMKLVLWLSIHTYQW